MAGGRGVYRLSQGQNYDRYYGALSEVTGGNEVEGLRRRRPSSLLTDTLSGVSVNYCGLNS